MSYSNGTRYFSMILLEETSRSREPSGGKQASQNLQTLQSKWWPSLEMFLNIGQHSATIPAFRSQTAKQNQDKADKKAKSEDECTLGNVGNKDGDHISNEHRMSNYQLVFIKI